MEARAVRILLRVWAAAVMLFLYVPIVVVLLYAFNRSNIQSWPISSYSLKWFSVAFRDPDVRSSLALSLRTIIVGHATFCIVIVYNNVIARLRRTSPSLFEASMDLGAHGWTIFRTVTFPLLSTAFIAGALLAFALSFDEVVVTLFTAGAQNTLPLWVFGAISRGQQLSEVNAVVFFVIALTIVPITIATRLTGAAGVTSAASRPTARS